MLKLRKLITLPLILLYLSTNVFGAGDLSPSAVIDISSDHLVVDSNSSGPEDSLPVAQATLEQELGGSNEVLDIDSITPPQTGIWSTIKSCFCSFNRKKAGAILVSALILGGAGFYAATPLIWPECKTIYDESSKICAFDRGEAIQYNPGDITRGMYVSLWADDTITRNQEYQHILGNQTKEEKLLDFIERNKIDSLSIYNLGLIFDTQGMSQKLSDFIIKAKKQGLKEVNAIGNSKLAFNIIADFQRRYPARFDGLTTEIEFWHLPGDQKIQGFKGLIDLVKYARKLNLKNIVSGKNLKITVYFGVLSISDNFADSEIATETLTHADRVFQHCYGAGDLTGTHDPADAFRDCGRKMKVWFSSKKELGDKYDSRKIVPILSAEGREFRAITALPEEHYIGDWIQAHPSLDLVENAMDFEAANYSEVIQFSEFNYYEYMFLSHYLNAGQNITR